MDQTEQQAPIGIPVNPDISRGTDNGDGSSDAVSSSSHSLEGSAKESREDLDQAPSSSTSDDAMESASSDTGTSEETKQD